MLRPLSDIIWRYRAESNVFQFKRNSKKYCKLQQNEEIILKFKNYVQMFTRNVRTLSFSFTTITTTMLWKLSTCCLKSEALMFSKFSRHMTLVFSSINPWYISSCFSATMPAPANEKDDNDDDMHMLLRSMLQNAVCYECFFTGRRLRCYRQVLLFESSASSLVKLTTL